VLAARVEQVYGWLHLVRHRAGSRLALVLRAGPDGERDAAKARVGAPSPFISTGSTSIRPLTAIIRTTLSAIIHTVSAISSTHYPYPGRWHAVICSYLIVQFLGCVVGLAAVTAILAQLRKAAVSVRSDSIRFACRQSCALSVLPRPS
jgi:hypothetical protein